MPRSPIALALAAAALAVPRPVLVAILVAAALAVPASAHAGNPIRPRTPVIHLGETCLLTLDRAATPVVTLEYTLPYEDPCDIPHGAPTQQFLSLCRGLRPGQALPQWLSDGDLQHAVESGVTLPLHGPTDVVTTNPEWSDCVARIADPRLITCEAAVAPVEWDLQNMSPGTYAVAAYTFQPPLNLWTPRWGLFRIVDGDDRPPAVALANREAFYYTDDVIDLDICVAADPGASVDLSYALFTAPDDWLPIAADLPVVGDHTLFPWDPPPELDGQDLVLRVEIHDLAGRSAATVAPELLHLLKTPGMSPDPPVVDPVPDICRTPDQEIPQLACPVLPGTGTDGQDPNDMSSEPGCGCTTAPSTPPLLLLLALRRRQRGSKPAA